MILMGINIILVSVIIFSIVDNLINASTLRKKKEVTVSFALFEIHLKN